MYRGKITLARVEDITVSFNLIINQEEHIHKYLNTVNITTVGLNTYLNIMPHPFVTIDFQTAKAQKTSGGYNSNLSITLNKIDLYKFVRAFARLYGKIMEFEDKIYVYDNDGNLTTNAIAVQKFRTLIAVGGKQVLMQPSVIIDKEVVSDDALGIKGVIIAINNIADSTTLSLDNVEFLIHTMKEINMHTLSMQLIQVYLQTHEVEPEIKTLQEQISSEAKPNPVKDVKPNGFFTTPSTIPVEGVVINTARK